MRTDLAGLCVLLAALSLACGDVDAPHVSSVTPDVGSALGGDVVAVAGDGFDEGAQVTFGGEAATAVKRESAQLLKVTVPRHLAATVDVQVQSSEGGAGILEDAYVYEPLELELVRAAEHHFPDMSELDVSSAAAADFDGDGADDLLVAVRNAAPQLLLNNGAGSFIDPSAAAPDQAAPIEAPNDAALWVHDSAALLVEDFDGDGDADVFLCNRGGQPSRIALNDGSGRLTIAAAALPAHADDCRAAVLVDMDGDGLRDVVVLGRGAEALGDSYLRLYLRSDDGAEPRFALATALEEPAEVDGLSCEEARCGELALSSPELTVSYTMSRDDAAEGSAAGVVVYELSPAPAAWTVSHAVPAAALPEAIALDLFGDSAGAELAVQLVDAEGERFEQLLGPVDWNGWKHLRVAELASWTPSGGDADGVIDLPIGSLSLSLSAAAAAVAGEVRIDALVMEIAGGGDVIVENFERTEFALSWQDRLTTIAADDLDGDGDVDLVLGSAQAGAQAPLRMLLSVGDAGAVQLQEALVGGLATVSERVIHTLLLDGDGDGDRDLVTIAAADGQDRMLLNDGHAHFFDDTAICMPVDRAAGRHARAADFNLDGHADLAVANHDAANRLYLGRGDGRFVDVTPAMPLSVARTLMLLPIDVDGDGALDLFELNRLGERSELYVSTPAAPER